MIRKLVYLLALFAALNQPSAAHEVRPALLSLSEVELSKVELNEVKLSEVKQSESDLATNAAVNAPQASTDSNVREFTVIWKNPLLKGTPLNVTPVFAESCSPLSEPQRKVEATSVVSRWQMQCSSGLRGQAISFAGLENTLTDVIVRYQPLEGKVQTMRVVPDDPVVVISLEPSSWQVVKTYFSLGVEHISFGIDHLLFVLALILLISGSWRLVKAITAFTVAHSITLAASSLGHFSLPPPPVEAVIALSIVFLANELALANWPSGAVGSKASGKPANAIASKRLSQNSPWLVSFCFGLLHGFGFAGALGDIGLPEGEIPLALLMFNVGVEAGQLIFIALALVILSILSKLIKRPTINLAASYIIGSGGCFWLVQRLLA